MGEARIEARVPGGIWSDNDPLGVASSIVEIGALEVEVLWAGLIIGHLLGSQLEGS